MTILSFLLQVGYQNKTVVDANWTKNLIAKIHTDLRNLRNRLENVEGV